MHTNTGHCLELYAEHISAPQMPIIVTSGNAELYKAADSPDSIRACMNYIMNRINPCTLKSHRPIPFPSHPDATGKSMNIDDYTGGDLEDRQIALF